MKLINLAITPAQKSKLRNLKSIKINPKHKCMSGSGISMLVDETNYNALTKRFDNNNGMKSYSNYPKVRLKQIKTLNGSMTKMLVS